MALTVNGEACEHDAGNVAELLRHLGVDPDRVAVELNGAIVLRCEFDSAALGDGDSVEVVRFVCGG